MANSLSERYPRALVTGASSGLGAAFAQMLLDEGVEVWGTSRDGGRLPQHERFHPLALDLDDGASMGAFAAQMQPLWPQIDLLVNNAGEGVFNAFESMSPEDIGSQLRVLLHGPVALCHMAYPYMQARRSGAIVNVASVARTFPLPYFSLYNSAKAGLSNFSRSLQIEAVGSGIAVIDFQPGDYRTQFNNAAARPEFTDNDRLARAWLAAEKHLQEAPLPQRAADDLRRALLVGRSGLVRSGGLFQCRLAPALARFAPWSLLEKCIRRYYGI